MKPRPFHRLAATAALAALLSSCASRTPPEFLHNASAAMFGGVITTADGQQALSAPVSKPNGFAIFYAGGDQ
jgi:hypothetical protein